MLPTPEAQVREQRAACIRAAVTGGLILASAPLVMVVHPLLLLPVLLASGLGAIFAYRLSLRRLWRRQKIVAQPFPPEWERILLERVDYYRGLPEPERERFRKMMQVFLAEKEVAGAGVEIDPLLQTLVGASAVIPVFGFPAWEYGMLNVVVIRPTCFEKHFTRDPDDPEYASGLVGDGGIFSGAMVLAKPDLLRDFSLRHDRYNVGIHEFAHMIDKAGGHIDGSPVSLPPAQGERWEKLVQGILRAGQEGGYHDIPEYGFTDREEFFAVCSEYFFERPHELASRHPELYDMLGLIYRQEPRAVLPE